MQDANALICALLGDDPPSWPRTSAASDVVEFLKHARTNGVMPLLNAVLANQAVHDEWPFEIRDACRNEARAQAMYELAHRAELNRILSALDSVGVIPLILKGTALAYSHYPNPALRPRGDTDLLIPLAGRNATEHTLEELGYAKGEGVEGEFISYQTTWSRSDKFGATHDLDVHWRINNSQALAQVHSYDELSSRATLLPALGPDARALAPVDALIFACIHRAGHVNAPYFVDGVARLDVNRLIWLYDIHLLVSRMSAEELDAFTTLAAVKRIRAICRDALLRTSQQFATRIPTHVLEALDNAGLAEPSACFLTGGRMRQMASDFGALEGWGDRIGWVKELAFPPARYMRWKYADAAIKWLPILYARRGLSGMARLVMPRGTDRPN
jgi:hypothetical protein